MSCSEIRAGKTVSSYYGNDVTINQAGNTGVDATTRLLQDGFGNNTSTSLSDDVLSVKPVNDDTTGTFEVNAKSGDTVLAVDTTNSKVLVGASQVAANTHYKEFGMHLLDVQTGYHTGLVCNNMVIGIDTNANWSADESTFGNGADPALTLDLSADGTGPNLAAILWYLEDNITIDTVRFMASCNVISAEDLNFHLMSYTLDASSNPGDLSAGAVIADGTVNVSKTQVKTGTLTNSGTVNQDAGTVIVATVENVDSQAEVTCQIVVKYHIR